MSAEKHPDKARSEIGGAIKEAEEKAAATSLAGKKADDAKHPDKKDGHESAAKADKLAELTSLLQHVQADFENYKKRTEKEQQNHVLLGKAMMAKRILPVLDTFDHALREHKEGAHKDNTDGLKRIHSQLISALEAEGLRPIKAMGEKLDPYRHECLEEECSDHTKGTVLEEIQKGYMLNDFVLRHSLVKVSSGKKAEKREPEIKGAEKKEGQKEGEK